MWEGMEFCVPNCCCDSIILCIFLFLRFDARDRLRRSWKEGTKDDDDESELRDTMAKDRLLRGKTQKTTYIFTHGCIRGFGVLTSSRHRPNPPHRFSHHRCRAASPRSVVHDLIDLKPCTLLYRVLVRRSTSKWSALIHGKFLSFFNGPNRWS